MYNLIAASLFQNKHCVLPGIGKLSVKVRSAETDFVNAQIKAPEHVVEFLPEENGEAAFNEFSAISQLIKDDIERNGKVDISGLGSLVIDESGKINFTPIQLGEEYRQSVPAERVIRQNAAHAMLVGDKETTNVIMTDYFAEEVVTKDLWWVWAIVLGVVGIAAIVLHIVQHGYTSGNNHILEMLVL